MHKNVGGAIVRHDKAVPFRDIEPFDSSGNFNKANRFDRRQLRGGIEIEPARG